MKKQSRGGWKQIFAGEGKEAGYRRYLRKDVQTMNKWEDFLAALQKREEEEKKNTVVWALAIIGAVAAVAAIAYAVYRYFTPDYLEDFEDDFEDDFDNYFDVEDENESEKKEEKTSDAE